MDAARDLAGVHHPPECTTHRCAGHASGAVYGRDDSHKENTNPKCVILKNHPGGHNGNGNGNGVGASQRFSGNLKPTAAPIIGIPGKLDQGCARRQYHHHPPPAIFPKKVKTGGGGREPKLAVPESGSPKVSCIGKVLSGRERDRRRPPRSPDTRSGCCVGFGFLIRRGPSRKSAAVESVDWSPPPPPSLAAVAQRKEAKEAETEEARAAPALGGMRRFVSGRRAADCAAEMEDDGRVARSGPL